MPDRRPTASLIGLSAVRWRATSHAVSTTGPRREQTAGVADRAAGVLGSVEAQQRRAGVGHEAQLEARAPLATCSSAATSRQPPRAPAGASGAGVPARRFRGRPRPRRVGRGVPVTMTAASSRPHSARCRAMRSVDSRSPASAPPVMRAAQAPHSRRPAAQLDRGPLPRAFRRRRPLRMPDPEQCGRGAVEHRRPYADLDRRAWAQQAGRACCPSCRRQRGSGSARPCAKPSARPPRRPLGLGSSRSRSTRCAPTGRVGKAGPPRRIGTASPTSC
jgi:hypothetical protein